MGSCSLVGIGKFNLLFLWLIGGSKKVPNLVSALRPPGVNPRELAAGEFAKLVDAGGSGIGFRGLGFRVSGR